LGEGKRPRKTPLYVSHGNPQLNRIDANMKLLDIGQTIEETLTETGKTEVGLLGYVFEDYSFHKSTLSIRN
jgi:hypothetical protein